MRQSFKSQASGQCELSLCPELGFSWFAFRDVCVQADARAIQAGLICFLEKLIANVANFVVQSVFET